MPSYVNIIVPQKKQLRVFGIDIQDKNIRHKEAEGE